MNNKYWALSENIGAEIENKLDVYERFVRATGLFELWVIAHDNLYKAMIHLGDIMQLGENGEYSGVYINNFKSLTESKLNMVFNQKLAYNCKAENTDYKSQVQTILANGLLQNYSKDKNMETFIKRTVGLAYQIYGEAFLLIDWDVNGGKEYGTTETGAIIKDGDVRFRICTPNLVCRDPLAKSNDSLFWNIVTTYENKYELAAEYPEHYDKICSLNYDYINDFYELGMNYTSTKSVSETDLVPVRNLFHMPNKTLPQGRLVKYVDGQVLLDTPMPYTDNPVVRATAGDVENSIFAYTEAWDLLPLQKIENVLHSTVTTNQATWGVTSIAVPQEANIEKTDLGGGLKTFTFSNGAEPKGFNPSQTNGEIFKYMEMIPAIMQKLISVPNVRRGAPEGNLKSGYAIALVNATALEESVQLQNAYTKVAEDAGLRVIHLLQDFASVPRVAMIVGKSNRTYMKEFTNEDIAGVSRVIVEIGNPLSATMAGKMELAEQYINLPPEMRDKWMSIVNTGRAEALVEEDTGELLLIQSENESLQNGKNPRVLIVDNHVEHIAGHLKLLSSPEAREDEEFTARVLDHVQQHIDFDQSGAPILQYATKTPPPPAAPQAASPEMPPPMETPPMTPTTPEQQI